MDENNSGDQLISDIYNRIRDTEERQRLLKDRVVIIGKSFIEEREKNFKEIQDTKKTLFELKEDVKRIKELMQRLSEQIPSLARKEELMILQRQFDLFRKE